MRKREVPKAGPSGFPLHRREHFRGVVWPRGRHESGAYRYVVVGLLVTDEPIPGQDLQRFGVRTMVDGPAPGLADALAAMPQREATAIVGTADDVLLGLGRLIDDDEGR